MKYTYQENWKARLRLQIQIRVIRGGLIKRGLFPPLFASWKQPHKTLAGACCLRQSIPKRRDVKIFEVFTSPRIGDKSWLSYFRRLTPARVFLIAFWGRVSLGVFQSFTLQLFYGSVSLTLGVFMVLGRSPVRHIWDSFESRMTFCVEDSSPKNNYLHLIGNVFA